MGWFDWRRGVLLAGLVLVLSGRSCNGDTDQRDVFAINSLYVALGTPPLAGWVVEDGDPCGTNWQGVECVYSNITGLSLKGANLGGELGENLGFFSSIISIDMSGNHIGGPIPANLPITVRNLYLMDNQFTGSIPDTLYLLSELTDLTLGGNHLSGVIPDAFEQLKGLVSLDLSANNLIGPLPPSMGNMSSLISFNMQNNQITGTLDVLQNLPVLANLNVENNLLSGPIPPNLLTLPNFRSIGNPFNTTIIPSPPTKSLSPADPPESPEPSPGLIPSKPSTRPSELKTNAPSNKPSFTLKRVIWICIAAFSILLVILLAIYIFMSKCRRKLQPIERLGNRPPASSPNSIGAPQKYKESLVQQINHLELPPKNVIVNKEMHRRKDERQTSDIEKGLVAAPVHREAYDLERSRMQTKHPTLPPKLASLPSQSRAEMASRQTSSKTLYPPNSVTHYSVAELQQYTRSFSQGNVIGRGLVGSVFRAKLPEGKALAVKKLNDSVVLQSEEEFLQLVSIISKLKHPNVVELVGYCAEYSQYLLAYEYYRNGTLYDALHLDDELHAKLSWNHRMSIALGAARALEYLHETRRPPMTHGNFKSANLLLNDKLEVSVSDCGLSSVMSKEIQSQLSMNLSAHGYGAPELECETFTFESDTYSFGVVMLELLTARKPYDRLRRRGEQFLVTWALSQLHDIDSLSRMVDPSLKGAYPSKSLSRFADIISLCLQPEPEFRPPMSEIVQNIMHLVQQ